MNEPKNKYRPLISVIIPVYNGEDFIGSAIQSVINQKYHPLEIIVIDDGSTDSTFETVKGFSGNIRIYQQAHSGVTPARNYGLEKASGELISFIDADDVWTRNKIALQTGYFKKNQTFEVVIGFLLHKSFSNPDELSEINLKDERGAFALQLGCALIKKEVFEIVGNFDECMKMSEDIDWFLRAREKGINVFVHPEIVQFYRIHKRSMTNDQRLTNRYLLKAFKKSLDRKRAAGLEMSRGTLASESLVNIQKFWQAKK